MVAFPTNDLKMYFHVKFLFPLDYEYGIYYYGMHPYRLWNYKRAVVYKREVFFKSGFIYQKMLNLFYFSVVIILKALYHRK